jgi:hypothetical protein
MVTSKPANGGQVKTGQWIEHRMDELAREYHRTHDEKIKDEIVALSLRLVELDTLHSDEWLTAH